MAYLTDIALSVFYAAWSADPGRLYVCNVCNEELPPVEDILPDPVHASLGCHGAVLLQLFYPDLMIELFAEAVTFMGFLLAIEYDDDRMDFLTDFADRASFVQDVEFYYHIHKRFHILVLQLTNLESYQRMTGAMELRKVHLSVANALMKLYPRYKIYRVGYEGFALLIFNNNEQYVDRYHFIVRQSCIEF